MILNYFPFFTVSQSFSSKSDSVSTETLCVSAVFTSFIFEETEKFNNETSHKKIQHFMNHKH